MHTYHIRMATKLYSNTMDADTTIPEHIEDLN